MSDAMHPQGSAAIPNRLRTAALIAVLVGGAGSLTLMFRGAERRPPILLALFVVWVIAPFVLLAATDKFSNRWSALTRTTLYVLMFLVTIGSVGVYTNDVLRPRKAQAAFVYVMVPPVSVALIAVALATASVVSRRRSRPTDDS